MFVTKALKFFVDFQANTLVWKEEKSEIPEVALVVVSNL